MKLEHLLNESDDIEELSKEFFRSTDFLYLGRGINFPVALEGALKLKEISYIHAEGYPAGEMKHGPNALIDERLPVLFINTREEGNRASELRYEKTHSNIVEVKAREGIVISVLTEGDTMSARCLRLRHRDSAFERSALADSFDHSSCSCWLITSPSGAAAMWTNHATWRSQSRWSNQRKHDP